MCMMSGPSMGPPDLDRPDGSRIKPGDPDWTGDVGVPWLPPVQAQTERERQFYYSDAFSPFGGFAAKAGSNYGPDNPPEWHYNKDAAMYPFLPEDMKRGEGSIWKNEQDAFNRERLRVKNEVTLAPSDQAFLGGTPDSEVTLNTRRSEEPETKSRNSVNLRI